jgi:hypothetical protein
MPMQWHKPEQMVAVLRPKEAQMARGTTAALAPRAAPRIVPLAT